MKCLILVMFHKPYWFPNDSMYLPIQVGAAENNNFSSDIIRDDIGDNISAKNKTFCELTGLYWAWRNINAEVYGLCHYRRYLGGNAWWKPKKSRLLLQQEIEKKLSSYDLILPRKRHYWIETRESQYAHAHHIEDLHCAEAVLKERHPDYLPAWRHMLQARSGHICNMFIMRKENFNAYCTWLFDILFEAEKRLDISNYSEKDRRVFGYLGERLLDVWIERNQLSYTEVPVVHLESQHWFRKAAVFLKRKFIRVDAKRDNE